MKKLISHNKSIIIFVFTLLIFIVIIGIPRIFAEFQPIKSVEIFSENLSYQNKEPGAWKVTKSAYFTEGDLAKITIDVETTAK